MSLAFNSIIEEGCKAISLSNGRASLLINQASIVLYDLGSTVALTRFEDESDLVQILSIDKKTKRIREYQDEQADFLFSGNAILSEQSFSCFLGLTEIQGKNYLIFCRLGTLMTVYMGHSIYLVKEPVVIELSTMMENKELSERMAEKIGNNAHISYTKNITQRQTSCLLKEMLNHEGYWWGKSLIQGLRRANLLARWDAHLTLGYFDKISLGLGNQKVEVNSAARLQAMNEELLAVENARPSWPGLRKSEYSVEAILLADNFKQMLYYSYSEVERREPTPEADNALLAWFKSFTHRQSVRNKENNCWMIVVDRTQGYSSEFLESLDSILQNLKTKSETVHEFDSKELSKVVEPQSEVFRHQSSTRTFGELLRSKLVDMKAYPYGVLSSRQAARGRVWVVVLDPSSEQACAHKLLYYSALLAVGGQEELSVARDRAGGLCSHLESLHHELRRD